MYFEEYLMSNITIDLTASFVHASASMPWGTYNTDVNFQSFCDSMVKYVYRKMGGDVLQLEITNLDVYSSVEESVFEYSAMINAYHAKSVLAGILGAQTGSLSGNEQKLPKVTLALEKRKADAYAVEALVGRN